MTFSTRDYLENPFPNLFSTIDESFESSPYLSPESEPTIHGYTSEDDNQNLKILFESGILDYGLDSSPMLGLKPHTDKHHTQRPRETFEPFKDDGLLKHSPLDTPNSPDSAACAILSCDKFSPSAMCVSAPLIALEPIRLPAAAVSSIKKFFCNPRKREAPITHTLHNPNSKLCETKPDRPKVEFVSTHNEEQPKEAKQDLQSAQGDAAKQKAPALPSGSFESSKRPVSKRPPKSRDKGSSKQTSFRCERSSCGIHHDGLYGVGRFCSKKCARTFSIEHKYAQRPNRSSQNDGNDWN